MPRISKKISPLKIIELKKTKDRISKLPADGRWIAVVRIRGTVNRRKTERDTLAMLRLHKPNHAVIIPLNESYKGMLIKINHLIAWGELNLKTLKKLLKKRGRATGNKRLTDDLVKEYTKGEIKTIDELAEKIWKKEIKIKELKWLKPVFRLHPPSGGWRGTVKRSYELGGSYGYWGEEINKLLENMI